MSRRSRDGVSSAAGTSVGSGRGWTRPDSYFTRPPGRFTGTSDTLLVPPELVSWAGRYDDPAFLDGFSLWPGPGGGIIVVGL